MESTNYEDEQMNDYDDVMTDNSLEQDTMINEQNENEEDWTPVLEDNAEE